MSWRDGRRFPAVVCGIRHMFIEHVYLPLQVHMSAAEARVASDHRGRRKRPGLLKRVAAAWRRRRYGEPGHSSGSMFVPARHASANVSVPAIDFSEWLLRNVRPQDHLVLHIDIAGAEFEVRACPCLSTSPQASPSSWLHP